MNPEILKVFQFHDLDEFEIFEDDQLKVVHVYTPEPTTQEFQNDLRLEIFGIWGLEFHVGKREEK